MVHDLYQETILDHSKRPRNFHPMDDANRRAEGYNPLCGDKLKLFLKVENDIVIDARAANRAYFDAAAQKHGLRNAGYETYSLGSSDFGPTLQRLKVPSRMVNFPDEGHWVLKPKNSAYWHKEVFAWLEKHVKPGGK